MSRLPILATALLAGAAFLPIAAAAQEHDHAEASAHYRLFVGDHAAGMVRAVDLADGAQAGRFPIDQTPALTRSASGRIVFAVQGDSGKVALIDTGVALEDHGDHADLVVNEARLLPFVLTGTTPAHVVEGSGRIAIFDDGTGDVRFARESALLAGEDGATTISPGAAHHGLAAPIGDFTVVSVPNENPEELRVGLKIVDGEGADVGEMQPCPAVHGQASSAGLFAFGCRDGVVVARPGAAGEPPVLEHLSTAGLGEGHVSSLRGGQAMQYFLGNYGPSAMVVIEPDEAEPFRRIDLPTRRVDFALDPANPADAFVLTEDGQLHRLDVLSGEIEASARVTAPYSMDGHWRDPRPRIAVAGAEVVVTDPNEGVLRVVSAETLAESRVIEMEGTPYTIVAVGGSGAVH